jgi:hypothetical protein
MDDEEEKRENAAILVKIGLTEDDIYRFRCVDVTNEKDLDSIFEDFSKTYQGQFIQIETRSSAYAWKENAVLMRNQYFIGCQPNDGDASYMEFVFWQPEKPEDVCHCGIGEKEHGWQDNHYFIPANCNCGYAEPVFCPVHPDRDLQKLKQCWEKQLKRIGVDPRHAN